MKYYYFIGILGSGMSGLARIQHEMGNTVGGSDRNTAVPIYDEFKKLGIKIYQQDGNGIREFAAETGADIKDIVIVKSTAIEDTVPDIVAARKNKLAELHRSDLLAEMFNEKNGIAVGGTAGKTSVSTMTSYALSALGISPSFVIGGISRNFNASSHFGASDYFVIESDESDGTIIKYKPQVAVLTNISKEHKELPELLDIFTTFISNIKPRGKAILNISCPNVVNLLKNIETKKMPVAIKTVNFEDSSNYSAIKADYLVTDIEVRPYGSRFKINGHSFETGLIGRHNVENIVLSAITAIELGSAVTKVAEAFKGYLGVARRLEIVGRHNDTIIIDDYAHNPHEIECAIKAVKVFEQPVIAVYQPHGFGPTSFTRNELSLAFHSMGPDDAVFLSEVYYGGGTVNRNVSSVEIVDEIKAKYGYTNAFFSPDLNDITEKISNFILNNPEKQYIVLVMGARNINTICPEILNRISVLKKNKIMRDK